MRTVQPSRIKACVFDIDGTMTDGRLLIDARGEVTKSFDIKDGMGIALLHSAGYKICVITGREDACNQARCRELKVDLHLARCLTKAQGLREVCSQLHITPAECLFMGDDLIDIPAMRLAGLNVAPSDAVPEVLELADWVMKKPAGRGAVREACEMLLKQNGQWEATLEHYLTKRT